MNFWNSMKPISSRSYLLNPESIALTDMVLNLFIFFFVSFSLLTTFNPHRLSRLEVSLPKASTGQSVPEMVVVVTITRNGRCHIGNRVVAESRLKEELAELARQKPGASVLVRADESAPCRSLAAVFDAGRAAGITRMNFAVLPPDGS